MIKIGHAEVRGATFGAITAAALFGWATFCWIHLFGADHVGVFLNDGRPVSTMVFFKATLICAVFGGISGRAGSSLSARLRRRDLLKTSIHLGIVNYAWAIGLLLLAATPLAVAAVLSVIGACSAWIGFIAGYRSQR
ncbi:hypothetical protein [Actinomadura mexicana]|uniref:Uncharacterized protein n=1 Tax=Actinomadura mexicana TaxID=134959 RepID=A0A238W119_9ACTN|nr:hypothetical protein [Actinomadura mexicana]SNR40252.1 hypothetical protein SAMN06265355_102613 [Actinomadura mexicana]